MISLSPSRAMSLVALAIGATVAGCADDHAGITGPPSTPRVESSRTSEVRLAVKAQDRHRDALLSVPGVVGTAVGLMPNGRPGVRVFVTSSSTRGVPRAIDGIPVRTEVTGLIMALSDPTTKQRPAPLGFSVGHPAITASGLSTLR